MDRRVSFFLLASIAGWVLTPVVDDKHRWVAVGVGVAYLLLAIAARLDRRTRDSLPPRYAPRR
jgi:hypothetical protein